MDDSEHISGKPLLVGTLVTTLAVGAAHVDINHKLGPAITNDTIGLGAAEEAPHNHEEPQEEVVDLAPWTVASSTTSDLYVRMRPISGSPFGTYYRFPGQFKVRN